MAKPEYAFGRPSKYDSKYCDELIEHMHSGFSFESFGGCISVTRDTLYNWLEKHPDFLDAKKIGYLKSRLFWERAGLNSLNQGKDGKFNNVVWAMTMKNRFGYSDNPEFINQSDRQFEFEYEYE